MAKGQGVRPLNEKKFVEAYMKFIYGEVSLNQAAKIAGCCKPTFAKYTNMVLLGEELPDNLFKKKPKKKKKTASAKSKNRKTKTKPTSKQC